MYTRLLTFNRATDIDAGVAYLRNEVLPVLNSQHGFRGVSASADRSGAVLGILSLWETEADRTASNSAMGKARDEATELVGGELTVENFEQVAEAITKPPVAGCALIVTRISMDPAAIDENVAFFKSEVLPQIKARPGFCALRNMLDRQGGHGLTGTVWEDRKAMEAAAADMSERRSVAASWGVSFDETTYREILLSEIK